MTKYYAQTPLGFKARSEAETSLSHRCPGACSNTVKSPRTRRGPARRGSCITIKLFQSRSTLHKHEISLALGDVI